MPLDVLIATPTGPFGELIRLTLEADPAFHCIFIDNGDDLKDAIQTYAFKALVYDCSCSQSTPFDVAQFIKAEYPSLALFFVPAESDPDMDNLTSIQSDGIITRPFDAILLPELIIRAVEKRLVWPISDEPFLFEKEPQPQIVSLSDAIHGTLASSGLIIQNSIVVSKTNEISLLLEDQVVKAILKYWNPADTSDLMRYIKDPESNQDWMMYATQIANSIILALLFQPQTPVTKVRGQTIQLSRLLAGGLIIPPLNQPLNEGSVEIQQPVKLQEILDESKEETNPLNSSFPVEWFREIDIKGTSNIAFSSEKYEIPPLMEAAPLTTMANEPEADEIINDFKEETPPPNIIKGSETPYEFPEFEQFHQDTANLGSTNPPEFIGKDFSLEEMGLNETPRVPPIDLSALSHADLDLSSFQPVDLIAENAAMAGLDSFQPVSLKSEFPELNTNPGPQLERDEVFKIEDLPDNLKKKNLPIEPEESFFISPETPHQNNDEQIRFNESGIPVENDDLKIPQLSNNDFGEIAPEDLTNIPDFTNLPIFLTTESNQTYIDDALGTSNNGIGSILSPSGQVDSQPDGEDNMENINSEDGQKNHLPDPEKPGTNNSDNENKSPAGNLFLRMNQLQSSAENAETETVTVALIPRLETFILNKQIAGVLNDSMNKLSQAFGWKLDNITIRPTYLQFTVTISTLFSPGDMVAIVRKQTNQFLLDHNQDIKQSDSSEDIWASESMMTTGLEFVPSNQWQNFILRRKSNEIA